MKYTPAAISLLPGDTFVEISGGFQQRRGASLIATFLKRDMTRTVSTGPLFINSSTSFAFYVEEIPMAAVAATMTDVTFDGTAYTFSHGPESVTKTLEELEEERLSIQNAEFLKKFNRVNAYAKSSGGANMTTMNGVPSVVDFDANQPIQVGE